jgi:hypothetical protein
MVARLGIVDISSAAFQILQIDEIEVVTGCFRAVDINTYFSQMI